VGFWLTPVDGYAVEVEPSTWQATVDLLEARRALEPETLRRMRDEWDTQVSPADALVIGDVLDEVLREGTPREQLLLEGRAAAGTAGFRFDPADSDRNRRIAMTWLTRFRDFSRNSGGFTIGWWTGTPAAAPPPGTGAVGGGTGSTRAGSGWQTRLKRLLGPFALILIVGFQWIAKLKFVFLAVAKLKFAGSALSGVVSIAAYGLIFGLPFAVLFVVLLFVHEMGHVIALRREGIKATAPMFIPFLGAVVGMKELPKDAWTEAKVALAGPILGGIGAAVTLAFGVALDSDLLRAAAYTAFFLNLFNLLPISPLDGGRAAAAIHPAFWLVGIAGIVGLLLIHPNIILILIALLGGAEVWRRWREYRRGSAATRAYYAVSPLRRVIVGVTFLSLVALFVLGMELSFVEQDRL
jgi:Zn-dependent protease